MKRILIIGGTGFIGRHLAAALRDAGHEVLALGRRDLDLARDDDASVAARLAGYGVVINAAGLIRDQSGNSLDGVHAIGTATLVRACGAAGVARLIQISALGASSAGASAYHRTKGQGEEALRASFGLDWCVLRPSVVFGRGGASTALFSALAALPWPLRLGPGTWRLQPVHVGDLTALVAALVTRPGPLPRFLDVVGPEPMTTDALAVTLRGWLGLPARRFLGVPEVVLKAMAAVGERLSASPLNRETLAMLKQGNVGDAGPVTAALGRPPRALATALAREPATEADRWHARLTLLRLPLRWSLGMVWLATAACSLGLYPLAESYRLMALTGLTGTTADLALYGAAGLDGVIGLLLLAGWRPVLVGAVQLAAMAAYTGIALALPAEYWLHPFAPLLKNLPLALAILIMMTLEDRR